MYTEADFSNARKTMKNRIITAVAVLLVAIALMVAGLIARNQTLAQVPVIVGACVFYTLFVTQCLPWIRYNRFLKEMSSGRKREMECYYVDISDRVRIVDGVQIHDMNASVDEAGEDLRLFYWDADKPMPSFEKGQRVKIKSYGNFVLEIQAI